MPCLRDGLCRATDAVTELDLASHGATDRQLRASSASEDHKTPDGAGVFFFFTSEYKVDHHLSSSKFKMSAFSITQHSFTHSLYSSLKSFATHFASFSNLFLSNNIQDTFILNHLVPTTTLPIIMGSVVSTVTNILLSVLAALTQTQTNGYVEHCAIYSQETGILMATCAGLRLLVL